MATAHVAKDASIHHSDMVFFQQVLGLKLVSASKT